MVCACLGSGRGNRLTDWGELTNLGPKIEVNVDLTGSSTVNIDPSSGTLSAAAQAAITNGTPVSNPYNATVVSGGTTVTADTGSTLTLSPAPLLSSGEFTLTFATTAVPNVNPNLPGSQTLAEGSGVPVGIPIHILGVNNASGTTFTFSQFANGNPPSSTTNDCNPATATVQQDAANDPNTATAGASNAQPLVIENNVHQLELVSSHDFPSDSVDQAVEEATTLYFMGQGAYNTNNFIGETTINGVNFSANLLSENGLFGGTSTELPNQYPTSRTLSNIIRPDQVWASAGGFAELDLRLQCQLHEGNRPQHGPELRPGVEHHHHDQLRVRTVDRLEHAGCQPRSGSQLPGSGRRLRTEDGRLVHRWVHDHRGR